MRRISSTILTVLLVTACGGGEPDAVEAPEAELAETPAAAPAAMDEPVMGDWQMRGDGDAALDEVTLSEREPGMWEVDNGPAIVAWRDGQEASGQYTISATVHQHSGKGMTHGAGLIFGGANLDGPAQAYTYFMVRGTGDVLVKTRAGEETFWVAPSDGWVPNDAVAHTDDTDMWTNELSVTVGAEETAFMVNGTEVFRAPNSEINTDGHWGIRANHNMTVWFSELEMRGGM
jgi:hypothetical protein